MQGNCAIWQIVERWAAPMYIISTQCGYVFVLCYDVIPFFSHHLSYTHVHIAVLPLVGLFTRILFHAMPFKLLLQR